MPARTRGFVPRLRVTMARRAPGLRRLIREVVPALPAMRRRAWRASAAARPTDAFIKANGLTVAAGPFSGLVYPPREEWRIRDLAAKLSGAYESELGDTVDRLIAARPTLVVDVGSAEGYYAVGLALRLPGATVLAYDIDSEQRELLAAVARLNRVADRVIGREYFPSSGWMTDSERVAVIFDCEGAERELVDPAAHPGLRRATMLIELHEFVDRDLVDRLKRRCAPTHTAEIVVQQDRRVEDWPAVARLAGLAPAERQLLLDERRPERMRWLVLAPKRGLAGRDPDAV
jgi:hypothetical protein